MKPRDMRIRHDFWECSVMVRAIGRNAIPSCDDYEECSGFKTMCDAKNYKLNPCNHNFEVMKCIWNGRSSHEDHP